MKLCIGCNLPKPISEFDTRPDRHNEFRNRCKECRRLLSRLRYETHKANSYFKFKATRAKSRASYLKVPYDLTPEYLEHIWTDVCPVFGLPLNRQAKQGSPDLAELDRFVPKNGYTQGNVRFISHKANTLKNNATIEEIRLLLEWMETNSPTLLASP